MSKTIGVIGLGIIGGVWARNYAADGVLAGAWNRTAQPDFPKWLPGPAEVAAASDVIQIVVADPPAVEGILQAILPRLGAGKLVIQSSTIDPESSDRFHGLVTATGAQYLESPFAGGKSAAEARKNNFYLGGSAEAIALAEPLISRVSQNRFLIGDHRQAASFKLATNLYVALQIETLAESLTFARRAGISDDVYFSVFEKSVAYSPLVKMKEDNLRRGDFPVQFSIKHMHKDMRLAEATAGADAPPLLKAVRAQLRRAEDSGLGDEDFSALIKLLKK